MFIKALVSCAILTLVALIGVVVGVDYSHKYDTFEISFSTPTGVTADVSWGTQGAGLSIMMDLSTGENLFVFPHKLSGGESGDVSQENLENLWVYDAKEHSTPTITKLDNGDYIVTGRMMRMDSMITRVMRTFDFNGDGAIDFYALWNGDGKVDYNLMNTVATSTRVRLFEPSWN